MASSPSARPRARRKPPDAGRRRLEVLNDVTRRLAAVQDTEKILAYIVNAATTLLGAEAAGLRLRDGDELVMKARTESGAAMMARARVRIGESLSGHVLATGEPLVIEDVVEDTRYDPRHKRAAAEMGFHGFVAVPLRAHERIVGVLTVFTKQRRRFEADEIDLLSAFADQASVAIEKDRMLQEARGHAVRLQALARLSQAVSSSLDIGEVLRLIAVAAAELTGAPNVSCWVADEPRRQLELRAMSDDRAAADFPARTVRFDQGIEGWVASHGRALNVPDVTSESRIAAPAWYRAHELSSAYATPIVFHSSLLGVLVLSGTAPFQLTEDDRSVLDAFVTQAGVAIRNARLYDEARLSEERLAQRSRELDVLNRMGEMLQACVTEDEAYAVVGRFVSELFPGEPGGVFVTSASRNLVEARAVWAATASPDWAVFKPEECWALRRGRLHLVESTASGLLCSHLPQPAPASYLCIPLIAQGESLGLLYLGANEATWSEPQQRLAATVADQLGLAVANLKLRETLRNQSIRDPLTGLFNRRYLEETLERELRRGDRSQSPLGVVMIDLDHFKLFNDTHGHDAGDMLLRDLGRLLQSSVRSGDVACRYGGEEFMLILPGADTEITRKRAERIREAVKNLFVSHRGQSVGSVTMSAGIAAFPDHGTTGEVLTQAADAALYRAKTEGRDRVVVSALAPGVRYGRVSARYLVWDFDGTLATGEGHWPGALCEVIRRARPDLAITPDDIRPHIQTGFPWHAPDVVRPACSADEWWASLYPLFARAYRACAGLDDGEARRLAEAVRDEYTAPRRWRLFDDVRPVLTDLRARGWRHLVLSNHVPELAGIIATVGLHELIDAAFCSADIGAEKPHRSTFETVFARYPGARTGWMIGDSWRADVEGARAVGLRAILVRTRHAEAALQCETLHDVIPIVEAGRGDHR